MYKDESFEISKLYERTYCDEILKQYTKKHNSKGKKS